MQKMLQEVLTAHGVEYFGVCSFEPFKNRLLTCRAALRLPENSKSVIPALFPYKCEEKSPANISRYAAVEDYHTVCGRILEEIAKDLKNTFDGYRFEPFIDNSPIPEVAAAALSGLGVVGKNGLLINEKYGSFCFIGEIVTDLQLPLSERKIMFCDNCGACINACPSACLGKDGKAGCLSAITQKKGELSEKEKNLIINAGTVWGCDICQNVCPKNKTAARCKNEEFIKSYKSNYIKGEDIENRAFAWRGKEVIERNAELLKI